MDDEPIKDSEGLEAENPDDELADEDAPKKPKSLLDDENVVSSDDLEEDELELDKEDLMDDVEDM